MPAKCCWLRPPPPREDEVLLVLVVTVLVLVVVSVVVPPQCTERGKVRQASKEGVPKRVGAPHSMGDAAAKAQARQKPLL